MTLFIALLRAVNVGGTGKLPMSVLKIMCEDQGFTDVRTYIASGNVLFRTDAAEAEIKAALEARLERHAGRPVGVLVRTAAEMAGVLAADPFPDAAPNHNVVLFLDRPPAPDALDTVTGRKDELLRLGRREIHVHYGSGMGRSRLRIPAADSGTARNMNTVAKLVAMAAALEDAPGQQ